MSAGNIANLDLQISAQWIGHARTASEQLFYLKMPVAHIVAHEDHMREDRRLRAGALMMRSRRSLMQSSA